MVKTIFNVELGGKRIPLRRPVCIIMTKDGQSITVTEGEAIDISEELHRMFYAEPTYDELEDKVVELESKVEDLESELEGYREEPIRYMAVRI